MVSISFYDIMNRKHYSHKDKRLFRHCLINELNKCVKTSYCDQTSDIQLIQSYDQLPQMYRHKFWNRACKGTDIDPEWANKHYLNVFKQVKYDVKLTDEDKINIAKNVKQLTEYEVPQIINVILNLPQYQDFNPFEIKYFIYQSLKKYQKQIQKQDDMKLPVEEKQSLRIKSLEIIKQLGLKPITLDCSEVLQDKQNVYQYAEHAEQLCDTSIYCGTFDDFEFEECLEEGNSKESNK